MIKHVHTDSNMEFCSKLLNEFWMKDGIVRYRTNNSEPQHIVELISQLLLETACKMPSNTRMAKRFQANVLSMVSYIVKRSSSIAIECQTAKECGWITLLIILLLDYLVVYVMFD